MNVQQQRRFNSMERRPRMLKDFLSEDSNSCSSSGFKSFPRKPNDSTSTATATTTTSMRSSLVEMDLKSRNSNSSAFQTLINAVRSLSFFTAVRKSPSILLPRSLSRKLSSRSRRNYETKGGEIKITVKIKDIMRWKSFRDLVEEQRQPPPPLDFHRCTALTTTTGSTTTTTCSSSSSSSSWSDSDFTSASGYLSSWDAQNNVGVGKKISPLVVSKDSVEPTTGAAGYTVAGTKEVLTCQEEEQQSPVSVLQVGEDEVSPFDQSLAHIERRKQKFMQTVQRFESLAKFDLANLGQCLSLDENSGSEEEYDDDDDKEVEERDWVEKRARQLLHCIKATGSVQSCEAYLNKLLLDFFREKLSGRRNQTKKDDEFEREILRIAEDWIDGSFANETEHDNKDACIKDMDRRGRWSWFEEEQEELVLEIETALLHSLVADLLDLDG